MADPETGTVPSRSRGSDLPTFEVGPAAWLARDQYFDPVPAG